MSLGWPSVALTGLSIAFTLIVFVASTRASKTTAQAASVATQRQVDAQAWERAKDIYEGAITRLEAEVDHMKATINEMDASLKRISQELAAARTDLASARAEIARLADQVTQLNQLNADLHSRLKEQQ